VSEQKRAGKGVREHMLASAKPSHITIGWHGTRLQTQSPLPPSNRLRAGLQ